MRDPEMEEYYDLRAPEYDHAYTGEGRWTFDDASGLAEVVPAVEAFVASLRPRRTLDVGCGTGYLARYLRGDVVGIDRSSLDGTRFEIYERYFRPGELLAELGGGEIAFSHSWFVAARAGWR